MALPPALVYTLEQYDAAAVDYQGVIGSGVYAAIPSGQVVGFTGVPVTPPWPPNAALIAQASGVAQLVAHPADITMATCVATDNADGSGASYSLSGVVTPPLGSLDAAGAIGTSVNDSVRLIVTADNPTDHTLYLQSITGTIIRYALIPHDQTVPIDVPPVTPPTTPPPPTNLPPAVIERKLLEAANPGFNCEIERNERTADLVTLFLGDKISLTVDGVRGKLGIIGRSHVVTRLRFRWQIQHDGDILAESVTTTATLEKIKGTLLGGAGTSSTDQDAAFTGGDMALFGGWDTAGAGWDSAGWAA